MDRDAEKTMNRRSFLKRAAGLVAAPLIYRSGTAFAAEGKPKIVVAEGGAGLKAEDGAYARMKAALDRLGGLDRIVRGKAVLLKMNATEGTSQDANTSPAAAAALLRLCREAGATKASVLGQEWGGYDSPRAGEPTLREVIAAGGANIIELPHYWAPDSKKEYEVLNPKSDVWKELWVARAILEPDAVLLNLARLKSHPHCVFTGCVKNIIGLTRCMFGFHTVDDHQWPQNHGDPAASDGWHVFPRKLATAHRDSIGPRIALNLLDAAQPTFGWRGPGSERIHTFDAHTTIVGHDALAIDVYGCGILHARRPDVYPEPLGDWSKGDSPYIAYNKAKTNYLVECGRLGVGETDLGKVNVEKVTVK